MCQILCQALESQQDQFTITLQPGTEEFRRNWLCVELEPAEHELRPEEQLVQTNEELTANKGDEKLERVQLNHFCVCSKVTEGRLRRQWEPWHSGEVSEGFRMWYAEVLDGRRAMKKAGAQTVLYP